ncbi:MAG: hypothetical protein AB7Q17_06790 [Phycisphaerae bacterium]
MWRRLAGGDCGEPATPPDAPRTPDAAGGLPPAFTADQLKAAMKAFKKRLKLARLDAESSLGHGPTSSGARSGIVAIVPPSQYPQALWDELARVGRLRRAGGGMYELGDS